MRRIVPIVEGHGEALSIPAFVRRILHDQQIFDIDSDSAIREHRQRLARPDVLQKRIRMAELRDDCAAVLVLLDADDDAACLLGPKLLDAACARGIGTPCHVILAVREVEAWLIAGVESLRGYRGIPDDLCSPDDPESIRGAKEWLSGRMKTGYKPTIDMPHLLQRFDYQAARHRAPSLDKFLRDLDSLILILR